MQNTDRGNTNLEPTGQATTQASPWFLKASENVLMHPARNCPYYLLGSAQFN